MVSSIIHTAAPWLTLQHNSKLRLNYLIISPAKKKNLPLDTSFHLTWFYSFLFLLLFFVLYPPPLVLALPPTPLFYWTLIFKTIFIFYQSLKSFLSVFIFCFSVFLSHYTVLFHSFASLDFFITFLFFFSPYHSI